MERLTAKDFTKAAIDHAILKLHGKLGLYTVEEYKALEKLNCSDWRFRFEPTRFNEEIGRLTMYPTSSVGYNLVERSKVNVLQVRSPHALQVSRYNLVGFVRLLRTNKHGNDESLQDWLLEHHAHEAMSTLPETHVEFIKWLDTHGIDRTRIRKQQLSIAAHRLLPKVITTLTRKPSKRSKPKGAKNVQDVWKGSKRMNDSKVQVDAEGNLAVDDEVANSRSGNVVEPIDGNVSESNEEQVRGMTSTSTHVDEAGFVPASGAELSEEEITELVDVAIESSSSEVAVESTEEVEPATVAVDEPVADVAD